MISAPSCLAARAARKFSPPNSVPANRIFRCCAARIFPRPLWRLSTRSFWTPESWRAAAAAESATVIFVRCRRSSASALAVSFAAAMTGAASISHWGSSPLCGWNGILSFLCRCMIIVCRRRSAPAGIRMIRAAVPQHLVPCGRIFPAQYCVLAGELRGGKEFLRLLS